MLFLYQIKSNCLSFADVKKSSLAQQRINRWQSSWNWHMPFGRQLFHRQSKHLYWIACQFFSMWCVLFLWRPLRRLRQEPRPTNSYNNPQHSYASRRYEKWGMRWRVVISLGMLILFKWWASKAVIFMFWSSNSRWMAISLMSDAQNSIVEKPWLNFREAITLSSNLSGIGSEVLYYGANFLRISSSSYQCSKSWEGCSTKSRSTFIPWNQWIGHVRKNSV